MSTRLTSTARSTSDEFKADVAAHEALVADLRARRTMSHVAAGGAGPGSATPSAGSCFRASAWTLCVDPHSPFLELSPLAAQVSTTPTARARG